MSSESPASGEPPYFDSRHAGAMKLAIELMTAIVEGFEANGQQPDVTLADYITTQQVGPLPPAGWDLLNGLTTLLLTMLIDDENNGVISKQAALDLMADGLKKMTPPDNGVAE